MRTSVPYWKGQREGQWISMLATSNTVLWTLALSKSTNMTCTGMQNFRAQVVKVHNNETSNKNAHLLNSSNFEIPSRNINEQFTGPLQFHGCMQYNRPMLVRIMHTHTHTHYTFLSHGGLLCRYSFGVVVSCLSLVVVVLVLLGMLLGVIGWRPKKQPFDRTGVSHCGGRFLLV